MTYRFPPFTFDTRKGELRKDDRPVKLHPQPARVLELLLSRAGEMVSREEIQNLLWQDETHVDCDLGINSCIRQIRAALEDDAESPRYLRTVPRRGYELIAGVETEAAAKRGDERWLWVVAGLVVIALGLVAAMAWMGRPESPKSIRSTPWTSLEGFELDPAFSPDGDPLAFVWDGGGDGFFHLYVKLVSGGDMLQLTDASADDRYPAWSPDGQEIAFARRTESGYEVRTVPALGGAERRLAASTAIPDGLDWSTDGRFIAMTDRIENNETEHILERQTAGFNWLIWEGDVIFVNPLLQKGMAVKRLDLDTLEVTTLVELGDEFTFSNGLDISSDGRGILFTVQRPQTTDLILVENFQ